MREARAASRRYIEIQKELHGRGNNSQGFQPHALFLSQPESALIALFGKFGWNSLPYCYYYIYNEEYFPID
jgi:hypothetical protein